MRNTNGLYTGRTEYRERDYRFARTCPGFRPEPEHSAGWAWLCAGAGVALLILIAVVMA